MDENELLEFHIRLCGSLPDHMIEDSTKNGKLFHIDPVNGQVKIIKSPNSRLDKIKGIDYLNLEQVLFKERYQSIDIEERMMIDFIKKCLVIDPYSRATCDQAMLHPWLLN